MWISNAYNNSYNFWEKKDKEASKGVLKWKFAFYTNGWNGCLYQKAKPVLLILFKFYFHFLSSIFTMEIIIIF